MSADQPTRACVDISVPLSLSLSLSLAYLALVLCPETLLRAGACVSFQLLFWSTLPTTASTSKVSLARSAPPRAAQGKYTSLVALHALDLLHT